MPSYLKELDTVLNPRTLVEEFGTVVTSIALIRRTPAGLVEVLLCKRGNSPAKGAWALPGGHAGYNENLAHCARRELYEETGLLLGRLQALTSQPTTPARAIKDILFAAEILPSMPVTPGSDVQELRWFNVANLPPVAFNHDNFVYLAVAKLMGSNVAVREGIDYALSVLTEADDKLNGKDIKKILDKPKPKESGLLLVFEGTDGVGKSTQCHKLRKWLEGEDYKAATTKWNSSKLMADAIAKAKQKRQLSPLLYSLLHAADMVARYQQDIEPALQENKIVICDRYYYTSLARDKIRDVEISYLDKIYDGFREPDVLFHCVAPVETCFARLIGDKGLSYYGTGMDLRLADSKEESCLKYQALLAKAYNEVLPKKSLVKLDMTRTVPQIASEVREIMGDRFGIGKYKS